VQKNGGESSSGLHRFSRPTNCVATFMPDKNRRLLTTFSPYFVNHLLRKGTGQLGAVIWTLLSFAPWRRSLKKKIKSHLSFQRKKILRSSIFFSSQNCNKSEKSNLVRFF
jgi:hypothetical protein